VGDVIALAGYGERRRSREARRLHAVCREILAASLASARQTIADATPAERAVQLRRLHLFEEASAYAAALG
jgi:hypothetical protein